MIIGGFCVVTMVPLALLLRGRAAIDEGDRVSPVRTASTPGRLPLSPCPPSGPARTPRPLPAASQCPCRRSYHRPICGDLGYGTARGAQMLSIMLGLGVVSRLGSGFIADRIGGLKTLILGSALQCLSLIFYLPFDGLTSLYIVSAIFGLSQGGNRPELCAGRAGVLSRARGGRPA